MNSSHNQPFHHKKEYLENDHNTKSPNDKWPINLIQWFSKYQRSMPWRSNPLPYNVWVSEIMLQQTQVITVIPYFERFITRFPSVHLLAHAHLDEILKLWEGLGYYSRARNLHKGSKIVSKTYLNKLPTDYNELQKIPGIGPYCAAAITSIAFGNPVPVVDGNVLRVLTRFWGIFDDIRQPKLRNIIFEKLKPYILKSDPSSFNQGIMELGALICTPRQPKCNQCPLKPGCFAFQFKKVGELPVKSKLKKTPHHHIAVGVLWKNNQFLIAKRPNDKMLGGLWELPGGKQDTHETLEETVCREFLEEVGLCVKVDQKLGVIKHAYSHFKITLHAFFVKMMSSNETIKENQELRWITPDEIKLFAFPTANRKIFNLLNQSLKLT